jgi:hypothetical protein
MSWKQNSELKTFMPIFIEVIKKINLDNNFIFIFQPLKIIKI